MNTLIADLLKKYDGTFMTVGIAGSVAVGKSTFASLLAKQFDVTTAIISTDDFLMSNALLTEKDIFNEKGFPQTYDLVRLNQVIRDFYDGHETVTIPQYNQEIADIDPKQLQTITRPKILIVEGVVALQLMHLDYKIYLEADLTDIKAWYLSRTLEMTALAKADPTSWRYQYTKMPLGDLTDLVMQTWDETNQVNLEKFILPSRQYANAIVQLNQYHDVQQVTIKNL
ncbi:type I pantothenate kinase [Leuconostoc citreum]|uniref:type I pantothenate kinase n=1 Tax=Leuconostoc citreum TaxID=33964 RepID=UPI00200A416F|nr:type I pantothenate kinase [Leuconostoc citreum]MCK8606290.1 type I pantothenate kinase [Leuconostoc citreum]MCQ6659021.1 type I pantothenate kinase [Leuconostoc citreum]